MIGRSLISSALALLCVAPALGLPKHKIPEPFRKVSTGGYGEAITAKAASQKPAPYVMQQVVNLSRQAFDGPMRIKHLFEDPEGRFSQASFVATMRGVPIHGLAFVEADGESVESLVIYDEAKYFPKTFARFVGGGGGSAPAARVALHTESAPDGSFRIGLPPGFHLSGNTGQGAAIATGPDGAALFLGLPAHCTSYRWVQEHPEQRGLRPAVDISDPVRAVQEYAPWVARQSGKSLSMQIQGTVACPWEGGRAAFVRYRVNDNGRTFDGFGLFAIMPVDGYSAMLYQSYMIAPPRSSSRYFPQMLQAWRSWSISPQLISSRLMAAAQTLRAASSSSSSGSSSYQTSQRSAQACSNAWSTMMRGQTVWEDPSDGQRYRTSNAVQSMQVNGVQLNEVNLITDP